MTDEEWNRGADARERADDELIGEQERHSGDGGEHDKRERDIWGPTTADLEPFRPPFVRHDHRKDAA